MSHELIKISSSFDRSTNLELDFRNEKKLDNIYIYSKFSQGIIEVLNSVVEESSNQRVRVLSGSPGLGKSTFALFICHLLNMGRNNKTTRKINKAETEELNTLKEKYKQFSDSKKRLMPIFLNGNMGNIEDAFLKSLRSSFKQFLNKDIKSFNKIIKEVSKQRWDFIDRWKKYYPEIYTKYLELLDREGEKQVSFEKSLKDGIAQSRNIFDRIYTKLTGGAGINFSDCDIISVYKKAITVAENNGYSGFFVVYDEFGKYLENGIYNPSSLNLQFLQNFAEYCDRSGASQCHLTLITHMSISQYASQLPVAMQKEWSKIEGRFCETAFYDRGANYFKMISHVFEKTIKETKKPLYTKLQKRYNAFTSRLRKSKEGLQNLITIDDCSEILAKCFPMHPLTIAFLPRLSQKVAQNERTLYTFLTRNEEYSLLWFLNKKMGNSKEPHLLMPSDLYKYFSPLIAKDIGIGGSYKTNLILSEALNKVPSRDHVSREILCIIALSTIIKNNSYTPTSENFIKDVLIDDFSEKEIKASIKKNKGKNILFYNKILKQYELYEGSSVNINEEIGKLKNIKLTSRRLVEIIKNYYSADYIVPKQYSFKYAITRFYRADIISVEELKAKKFLKTPRYDQEDGLIYYIIPFNKDEIDLAQKLLKEEKHRLVTFILPRKFIECQKDIEELNAINSIYSNKKIINSSPLVKKELDRYKSTILRSIEALTSSFLGKFSVDISLYYAYRKKSLRITHHHSLERELGKIFKQEYSSAIPLKNELINKHRVSGTITLARKILIDAIIKNPTLPRAHFGLEGFGAEISICYSLDNIFKFRKANGKDKLALDSKAPVQSLLEGYKKILLKHPNGIEFKDLIEILMAPPYGLRKGIIPLYVAIFDQVLPHPVNHYFDEKYIALPDGDHYDLLFKYPHLGRIKYSEISKEKEKYLKILSRLFNTEKMPNVSSVVSAIYDWRRKIPEYTLHNTTSVRTKKLLISIDMAKEPDKLLFEGITQALDCDFRTASNLKKFEKIFKYEKEHTIKFYQDLIKRVHASLIDALYFMQEKCLGGDKISIGMGENLAILYKNTWMRFPDIIKKYRFNKSTTNFINRFLHFDNSKKTFFFVETIADALTGSHPRYWREEGETTFRLSLERVLDEIEMVCEFLNKDFHGESAIAFINRKTGKKNFLRLGVKAELGNEQEQLKEKIWEKLKNLSAKDRNNILLKLLEEKNNDISDTTVSP